MNWKEIVTLFLGTLFGTGVITGLAQFWLTNKVNKNQLLFSNELNKRFFRFSNLYKDKLDIIREFYKLLVIAEKGLIILMTPKQTEDKVGQGVSATEERKSEMEEFKKKTNGAITAFFNYYEENEIVFENEIVSCVSELKKKFIMAENANNFAELFASHWGSEPWGKATQKKQDVYVHVVREEIPELKDKLKTIFQERYKLLETN